MPTDTFDYAGAGFTPLTGADNSAWTQYHDQLQQQKIAAMTDVNYANSPYLKAMTHWIDVQLSEAASSLNKPDASGKTPQQKMQELLSQFEKAQQDSQSMNESRYAEITGYNAQTGDYDQDRGFNKISREYGLAMNGTGVAGDKGVFGLYDQAAKDSATRDNALVGSYDTAGTAMQTYLEGLGVVQRADIGRQYEAERGAAKQGLARRGMGNTTVTTSVNQGLTDAEALQKARYDEQLNAQKLGVLNQYQQGGLSAQAAANSSQTQQAQQAAALRSQYASQMTNFGTAQLGAIERRTDQAPSLGDIGNLLTQLGRGSAQQGMLPAFGSLQTGAAAGTGNSLFQ